MRGKTIMKKVLLLLGVMLTLFFGAKPALAGPSINQRFTTGTQHTTLATTALAQTFMPSVSGLSYVEIQLLDTVADEKVSMAIRHKTGSVWDTGRVASVLNKSVTDGWNTFDFTDITVVKEDVYGIFVTVSGSEPIQTAWMYSDLNGTYPRGNAYVIYNDNGDGLDMSSGDLNFRTYGTEPVEMVDEQTNPGSDKTDDETGEPATQTSNTPTTTTKTAGAAPSASVSASIEPPADLTAEYTEGAKLSWSASSSSDIHGYIVFRTETAGNDYLEVGRTEKTVLEFTDSSANLGKTYYYIVRAFRGTDESANSSEASLATPSEATDTASATTATSVNSNSSNYIIWYLSGVAVLLLLLLAFLIIRRVKLQKNKFTVAE